MSNDMLPPLEPPNQGPYQGPMWPAPLPFVPRRKTASEIASGCTIAAGGVVFVSVFLPVFKITAYSGDYQWQTMTTINDAAFFMLFGLIIAGLGAGRLAHDTRGLRILVAITGVVTMITAVADYQAMNNYYVTHVGNSGLGISWGPAIFMIIAGALAAIITTHYGPKEGEQ